MNRETVKNMVRKWIVDNQRPMTKEDAELLSSDDGYCDLDVLLWVRDAAHYFATAPSEEQFKVQNNFDAKFNVRWLDTRHGPQPYLYDC